MMTWATTTLGTFSGKLLSHASVRWERTISPLLTRNLCRYGGSIRTATIVYSSDNSPRHTASGVCSSPRRYRPVKTRTCSGASMRRLGWPIADLQLASQACWRHRARRAFVALRVVPQSNWIKQPKSADRNILWQESSIERGLTWRIAPTTNHWSMPKKRVAYQPCLRGRMHWSASTAGHHLPSIEACSFGGQCCTAQNTDQTIGADRLKALLSRCLESAR